MMVCDGVVMVCVMVRVQWCGDGVCVMVYV